MITLTDELQLSKEETEIANEYRDEIYTKYPTFTDDTYVMTQCCLT